MNKINYNNDLKEKGWTIVPKIVNKDLVDSLRDEIEIAYTKCRSIQVKNGIAENTDGTVHHLLCFEGAFLEFLGKELCNDLILEFFESSPFILNTYGGVINLPNKKSYVANVHRDIRTFYSVPMMLNMLVMIDEFTLDNGATYLLSESHLKDKKPSDDEFYQKASRAVGPSGSILLFNSLTWHAAGLNSTQHARRALTLAFTRPFMKPQLDYPRVLGYDRSGLSDYLRQVVGYNSRIPASLDEWYQPTEKRFYKSGQG
jgi:hypothetical protein